MKYKEGDCLQHNPDLYACDNDWTWKMIKDILDECDALRKKVADLQKYSKKELDKPL